LRRELGWLASRLAEARALDVFAIETLPAARRARGGRTLDALTPRVEAARAKAYRRARHALDSARCARLTRRLAALGEVPAGGRALKPLVAPVLDAARNKVMRRAQGLARLDADSLHRLRIAV